MLKYNIPKKKAPNALIENIYACKNLKIDWAATFFCRYNVTEWYYTYTHIDIVWQLRGSTFV